MAPFTAIGDATAAIVGFFDCGRKIFKVIPVTQTSELSSFYGKQVFHTQANIATDDDKDRDGHLRQWITGPTSEVFLTVETTT